MEGEEKKLIADIKKMAKAEQMSAVKIQAKELVRTRNYITKFIQLRAHLNGVLLKIQCVKSHEAMASAMKRYRHHYHRHHYHRSPSSPPPHTHTLHRNPSTTGAMIKMNQQFSIPGLQKIMMEFQRENEKAELTQEMMGETLDDVMDEEGDEEEQDKIVDQVLDEIGVSFGDQIPEAAAGQLGGPAAEPAAAALCASRRAARAVRRPHYRLHLRPAGHEAWAPEGRR
mmetsp:Transcript_100879/g.289578  ORF Transcript_100879/g.289578 Transcript_100879/m.289578 type:complete len:227 (-) Transcript_100879:200-880(-)